MCGTLPRGRIVIVLEDHAVGEALSRYLQRDGYVAIVCPQPAPGLAEALRPETDLVILDESMRGMDGVEALRRIRAAGSVPLIVLSARPDERTRVRVLRQGADDFVSKPFSPRELAARVHAVLRRARRGGQQWRETVLRCGDLTVDVERRVVTRGTQRIELTPLEFSLLALLVRDPGRTFSHDELGEWVWGFPRPQGAAVRRLVHRLRVKVEPCASSPRWVHTVYGAGYRMLAQPDSDGSTGA